MPYLIEVNEAFTWEGAVLAYKAYTGGEDTASTGCSSLRLRALGGERAALVPAQ